MILNIRERNYFEDCKMMKIGIYKLMVLILIPVVFPHVAIAEPEQNQEYKIKAAFIFNFIKFVDWPKEKFSGEKNIVIGVIGKNPFGNAFDPIKNRQINSRKVVIKTFKSLKESDLNDEQIEDIRKCHALLICSSEKQQVRKIIDIIKGYYVLSIGETKDFLESDGIINFLIEDGKVCFEINNFNAKREKLDISSQLLRLAKRVVEEKTWETEN